MANGLNTAQFGLQFQPPPNIAPGLLSAGTRREVQQFRGAAPGAGGQQGGGVLDRLLQLSPLITAVTPIGQTVIGGIAAFISSLGGAKRRVAERKLAQELNMIEQAFRQQQFGEGQRRFGLQFGAQQQAAATGELARQQQFGAAEKQRQFQRQAATPGLLGQFAALGQRRF